MKIVINSMWLLMDTTICDYSIKLLYIEIIYPSTLLPLEGWEVFPRTLLPLEGWEVQAHSFPSRRRKS